MGTIPFPVADISDEKYAAFGKRVAALLGSQWEWRGAETLEWIGELALGTLGVSIGDQSDELFHAWHTLADELELALDASDECELCSEGEDGEVRTWTFFGHWDDGELVIDHAVEGDHEDVREDDGRYEGGLWADTGTGRTIEEAEADARSEYEDTEPDWDDAPGRALYEEGDQHG